MGTVAGDDIVQTTNPYYFSAYVAIYRNDKGFTFTDFDDPKLKTMRLGIVGATPPADLLVRHELMANTKPYALMVDTRYESPTHEMIEDIVKGDIDLGLLWGPIAGYYVKRDKLPLAAAVLKDEPGAPRMDYHIAMGVRANEPEWRRRINAAILKRQPQITEVLRRLRRAASRRAGAADPAVISRHALPLWRSRGAPRVSHRVARARRRHSTA